VVLMIPFVGLAVGMTSFPQNKLVNHKGMGM
jgi:hypothetical protein